jgi:rhamnose transport system ATP-binding protein
VQTQLDKLTAHPRSLLRAESISKNFSGVRALKSATLNLLGGEVHALIGENGAGKSALVKVITGTITPDSGRLEVAGQVVSQNSPAVARSLGIAAIYQQPSLFPHLTVAENIALALEADKRVRFIDWKLRSLKARELTERTLRKGILTLHKFDGGGGGHLSLTLYADSKPFWSEIDRIASAT